MSSETTLILVDQIEPLIHTVRGQNVFLDSDLATLYGVPTRTLNQAVKRNRDRFPGDFMFQLTAAELEAMRSQSVTASKRNVRHPPHVFTEHVVVMAASVLSSPQAVEVSVFVVRAFVKLRQLAMAHKDMAAKLDQLERKVGDHDESIRQLVSAIRQLMAAPTPKPRRMGFHAIRDQAKKKK